MKMILILLIIVAGLYGFFNYYLPKHGVSSILQSVEGIQTTVQNQNYQKLMPQENQASQSSNVNISSGILQNIESQVSHLKLSEVASSSTQIQQIIAELKKLPNDKIKSTCMQLCNGL